MIYGLIYNTPDYTNISYNTDLSKLEKLYLEEVVEAKESDDPYVTSIALIHITGNGPLEIGMGITGGEGVDILRNWAIENDDF